MADKQKWIEMANGHAEKIIKLMDASSKDTDPVVLAILGLQVQLWQALVITLMCDE